MPDFGRVVALKRAGVTEKKLGAIIWCLMEVRAQVDEMTEKMRQWGARVLSKVDVHAEGKCGALFTALPKEKMRGIKTR